MARIRIGIKLLSAAILLSGVSSARAGAPTVEEMLKLQPKQEGVQISTPAEAEIPACKVEAIKSDSGSGWLLRDPAGRPLRRFYDSNGDRYIDVWSYYQDGQEVYREIDTNFNHKADQYRWFGPAGMKVGTSLNEDGKINRWDVISPEEVSQEILQAVITRDLPRLQALMINEADLKALELPSAEISRIKEKMTKTQEKFNATTAALIKLSAKTKWVHLETAAPQCIPADALGSTKDLVKYKGGTILFEDGGKHDFLQTGEMIQVGRSWKIIEAPVQGYAAQDDVADNKGTPGGIQVTEETKALLTQLQKIDDEGKQVSDPNTLVRYNITRAGILEKLAEATKGEQHESWIMQLADSLSAAAQNSAKNDSASFERLNALSAKLAKGDSQKLAGYVAYRVISTEYSIKVSANTDMARVQESWRENLRKFVDTYPQAEDAPEALLQLGMVSEFIGKETEAKNWYERLAKEYSTSKLAAKAKGAVKRIDIEGKPFELAGPVLASSQAFDIRQIQGKVAIVYYWASWNGQTATDFAKLKSLQTSFGGKGLELVLVNLDQNQADAVNFLNRNTINGVNLFQPGALESPYAVNYGIMVLPNLFLIGKDGKVISRGVQIGGLEDEIKKLMN